VRLFKLLRSIFVGLWVWAFQIFSENMEWCDLKLSLIFIIAEKFVLSIALTFLCLVCSPISELQENFVKFLLLNFEN
jgi:hypothetical protein